MLHTKKKKFHRKKTLLKKKVGEAGGASALAEHGSFKRNDAKKRGIQSPTDKREEKGEGGHEGDVDRKNGWVGRGRAPSKGERESWPGPVAILHSRHLETYKTKGVADAPSGKTKGPLSQERGDIRGPGDPPRAPASSFRGNKGVPLPRRKRSSTEEVILACWGEGKP